MEQIRDNTVTTSNASITSNTSTNPHDLDDLDARGGIYTGRSRLRALWTAWSVEVRVLSGALGKPVQSIVEAWRLGIAGDADELATVAAPDVTASL
jgi:hypothetical protein